MLVKEKITPFLWFGSNAEEAANLYVSLFPDSRIIDVDRWEEGGPAPAGSVMSVTFEIAGRSFIAFNGGPHFKLNEAASLFVDCKTQEEIDTLWEKLTADGGRPVQCGWLQDKFGLFWQIIPSALGELLSGKEPGKSARVLEAMMKMIKLDIETLKNA